MWKLLIEDDEGARTAVPLHREAYAIGRAVGNEIRLTDWNVSREHAVLRRLGGSYEIDDRDSYNGTHLNGARVNVPRVLAAGDVVQVGDYVLVFERGATTDPSKPEEPSAPSSTLRRPARLAVLDGPGDAAGKEYPLDGDDFVVGREESADIPLLFGSVSRRHCRLVRIADDRFDVTDLGSANGISINGVELRRGVIEPGDTLQIGDIKLRYVADDEVFWPSSHSAGVSPHDAWSRWRAMVPVAFFVALVALGIAALLLTRR